MERKKHSSQHNIEEQSWKTDTPNFKTYCKIMVIKTVWYWWKTQTNRSIEQNREPRNRPQQKQLTDEWQRSKDNTMEKGQSLQQLVPAQLDIHMCKNKPRHKPHNVHMEVPENNIEEDVADLGRGDDILHTAPNMIHKKKMGFS